LLRHRLSKGVNYVVFKGEFFWRTLSAPSRALKVAGIFCFSQPAMVFMRSANHFFRLLSSAGLSFRGSAERQLGRVRGAMLTLLDAHGGHAVQRLTQRVRFADDLESLWYLRQDLLAALSAVDGEMAARRQMQSINRLFKGRLPGGMGPRAHQRSSS
jgi:hypothetical protein